MANTDKISIPVDIPPESIANAINQLKAALTTAASAAGQSILKGTLPPALPTIKGATTIQDAGRTFQATGQVQQKIIKDAAGIETLTEVYSIAVKEITQQIQRLAAKQRQEQKKAEDAAFKAWKEYIESITVSGQSLEQSAQRMQKQINAERKKAESAQTKAQQEARKRFVEDFDAAQAQLKFQMQQEKMRTVPGQDLEKSAVQMRAQLDAETKKKKAAETQAQREARRRFLEDFDAAQAEVRNQINARKQIEQGKKQAAQNAAQVAKERQRQFAANILTGASAGIGLFGQAGFPLLNIGFAAMSGNALGAGVAAVSTAIGEFARAINTLKEESVAAAKQLGFVSTGFKQVEARMQALQAVVGSGALAAQQAELQHRLRSLETMGPAGAIGGIAWQSISSTFRRIRDDVFTPKGATDLGLKGIGPTFFQQFNQQLKESLGIFPQVLQESRRNMLIQMNQGMPGVESDPYQVFLRMQSAALDTAKSEEKRLQQLQLEQIERQIKAMEKLSEAFSNPSRGLRFVGGILNPGIAW